jgi:microcystin-dependent protein
MTTRIQTFDGNIGIGTNDPGSYKLRVEGAVRANSIEINGETGGNTPIGLIAMWYGTVASIPTGWALCDGTTGIARSDGDGTIDTPNLVNKFVRGADGDAPSPAVPGTTGGADTVTITETELPSHTHTATVAAANANHNHNTNTANAPHAHNVQVAGANAPHGHNFWIAANSNGPHYLPDRAPRNSSGNWPVAGANAPHGHNGYAQGNNAPHNHGINGSNAPHSHNITVDSTGDDGALTITNPYYILAYIMKT